MAVSVHKLVVKRPNYSAEDNPLEVISLGDVNSSLAGRVSIIGSALPDGSLDLSPWNMQAIDAAAFNAALVQHTIYQGYGPSGDNTVMPIIAADIDEASAIQITASELLYAGQAENSKQPATPNALGFEVDENGLCFNASDQISMGFTPPEEISATYTSGTPSKIEFVVPYNKRWYPYIEGEEPGTPVVVPANGTAAQVAAAFEANTGISLTGTSPFKDDVDGAWFYRLSDDNDFDELGATVLATTPGIVTVEKPVPMSDWGFYSEDEGGNDGPTLFTADESSGAVASGWANIWNPSFASQKATIDDYVVYELLFTIATWDNGDTLGWESDATTIVADSEITIELQQNGSVLAIFDEDGYVVHNELQCAFNDPGIVVTNTQVGDAESDPPLRSIWTLDFDLDNNDDFRIGIGNGTVSDAHPVPRNNDDLVAMAASIAANLQANGYFGSDSPYNDTATVTGENQITLSISSFNDAVLSNGYAVAGAMTSSGGQEAYNFGDATVGVPKKLCFFVSNQTAYFESLDGLVTFSSIDLPANMTENDDSITDSGGPAGGMPARSMTFDAGGGYGVVGAYPRNTRLLILTWTPEQAGEMRGTVEIAYTMPDISNTGTFVFRVSGTAVESESSANQPAILNLG